MAGRHGTAGRRGGSFDAFDLARRGASRAGTLNPVTLPRVADRLASEGGRAELSWRIAGEEDALGRPALAISLDGVVPLVCQRCLQPFGWSVKQHTLVLLARTERELGVLDGEDEHEVVLAAAPLEALTLVEDELLLTLPFAPRCERAVCAQAAPLAMAAAGVPAFAALAAMTTNAAKKTKD